jgi:molecular chaperone DnaJ
MNHSVGTWLLLGLVLGRCWVASAFLLPHSHTTYHRSRTPLRMAPAQLSSRRNEDRGLYEVLRVPSDASDTDIRQAFKSLVRQFHPTVNDDPTAPSIYRGIVKAFNVLSNPTARSRYDQYGAAGVDFECLGGLTYEADLADIFEHMLGDGAVAGYGDASKEYIEERRRRIRQAPGPVQGEDLEVEMGVDFMMSCFGGCQSVRIRHSEGCDVCSGMGVKPGLPSRPCARCSGSGHVSPEELDLGRFPEALSNPVCESCPECFGTGKCEEDCDRCFGTGLTERTKLMHVTIPAGVDTGCRLRIKSDGHAGPRGGPKGDLYVVVNVGRHNTFSRSGFDISSEVRLSYLDAILGDCTVDVQTLDGMVNVALESGTQPDQVLCMKGMGVPELDNEGSRGDHFVKFRIDIPHSLTQEESALVHRLSEIRAKQQERRRLGRTILPPMALLATPSYNAPSSTAAEMESSGAKGG